MNLNNVGYCPVCKSHVPSEEIVMLDGGHVCVDCKDLILNEIRLPGTSVDRARQEISAEFNLLDSDFNT